MKGKERKGPGALKCWPLATGFRINYQFLKGSVQFPRAACTGELAFEAEPAGYLSSLDFTLPSTPASNLMYPPLKATISVLVPSSARTLTMKCRNLSILAEAQVISHAPLCQATRSPEGDSNNRPRGPEVQRLRAYGRERYDSIKPSDRSRRPKVQPL